MTRARANGGSPTATLVAGLLITLAIVAAYSWYISGQISGLRRLQTEIADRNRRDSLQLLRIQNDLNQLALAMRDMLDPGEPYPLIAWSTQFDRIRVDLDDALKREETLAGARRTPDQAQYLEASVAQFWDASNRIFELARTGREAEARAQVRLSLQARQAALSAAVARLLVQNNASERADRAAGAGDHRQRPAAGLPLPGRHAGRDRGDRPVPDPVEPAAVCPARHVVRSTAGARAAADHHA